MTTLAINIDQPYASLLAHGLKPWETRPHPPAGWPGIPEGTRRMPGCRLTPDDEVLVVASKKRPREQDVGEWTVRHDFCGELLALGPQRDDETYPFILLPLGAVVAVARVTDVVPIVDSNRDGPLTYGAEGPEIASSASNEYSDLTWWRSEGEYLDMEDQLPLGDWTPGRWAWRMEVRRLDPVVSEYEPSENNHRGHERDYITTDVYPQCLDCSDPDGETIVDWTIPAPVPVRGRQGVWRPDPALVAACGGES